MGGYSDNTEANYDSWGGGGGSAPAEGTSDWWASEISSREAEAAANTAENPQEGMSTSDFYTDPRTGQAYANYAQYERLHEDYTAPTTGAHTVTTPTGQAFTTTYSQYWMDPEYAGVEPGLDEKAYYSDATYAYANAQYIKDAYSDEPTGVQAPKTYSVQKQQIREATGQTGPDTSTLVANAQDLAQRGVDWISQNLLLVVIAVAAVIILPRILPSGRGYR